jgi:hypothetical protein
MKKINILQILFLMLVSGCSSNEYMDFTDTQIPVESADAQFTAIGGRKEIRLDFEGTYTAASDRVWCTASVDGKTVVLTAEPNLTVSGRTALLTVRSGNRLGYISVTQTSAAVRPESYTYDVAEEKDTVYVRYECDFPVETASLPDWIKSSANHEKKEIMFIVEAEKNYPRTATVRLYADGGNGAVLAITEISIRQNFLPYDAFIGPYTMYYSKSASVTAPNSQTDVSIVAGVPGKSYFLKGILADDGIGNIPVRYDELNGSLAVSGAKIIAAQNSDSPDFWWAPYQKRNTSFYVTPSSAYGMTSAEHDIEGSLKFVLKDDGSDPGYVTVGFILRKYAGTDSGGNFAGRDGQSMYMYPVFVKK